MKTVQIIIIMLAAFSASMRAQSLERNVIAAGGKTKIAGNIMLEYTIGETFVKTLSSPSNKITQGFHQPTVTVTRVMNEQEAPAVIEDAAERTTAGLATEANNFKVEIFPNPATDYIMVRTETVSQISTLTLIDISGKLVYSGKLNETEKRIDLGFLPNGKYFLSVRNEDGSINESFKLIKVN